MNLIKYQAFIKVVEMKSITKAAQSMGYFPNQESAICLILWKKGRVSPFNQK